MVTVAGVFTVDPPVGVWLCTVPGVPPLEEQSTLATAADRPDTAWMAPTACAWVDPPTLGTTAVAGPVDTCKFTGVVGGSCVPAAGFCPATSPEPALAEHTDVWFPTVRLA